MRNVEDNILENVCGNIWYGVWNNVRGTVLWSIRSRVGVEFVDREIRNDILPVSPISIQTKEYITQQIKNQVK